MPPGPEYRTPGGRMLQRVYGRTPRFPPEKCSSFRPRSPFFAFCSGHIREHGGKVVQPGMVRARLYQFSLRGLHPCEEHTLRRRTPHRSIRDHRFRTPGAACVARKKKKKSLNRSHPLFAPAPGRFPCRSISASESGVTRKNRQLPSPTVSPPGRSLPASPDPADRCHNPDNSLKRI